jgi:putative membrane protein
MQSLPAKLNEHDQLFLTEAAQGGLAEVKLSELAPQRAACAAVKQFAQRMIQAHEDTNQELNQMAARKGVTPPAQLDGKHQSLHQQLSGLAGEEFDRNYLHVMVEDHRQVIAQFEGEARQGNDEELKNWASQTLATLREHLRHAQQLAQAH